MIIEKNKIKIVHLKSIDSTHLYALRLIDSSAVHVGSSEVFAIYADEQTNGIGRCNRSWISEKGNLFASIIMNMPQNSDLGQLSLTVACAVRETILEIVRKHLGDRLIIEKNFLTKLHLHWPNDVYYDSAKISGLLLAVSNGMLVVSIGINIVDSPNLAERPTTNIKNILHFLNKYDSIEKWRDSPAKFHSKFSSSTELHCKDILDILLENVVDWISRLCNLGFSEIRSYWLQNIKEVGCNVTVRNGSSILDGVFLDINDSGEAVLQRNEQILLISSGDLLMNQDRILTSLN